MLQRRYDTIGMKDVYLDFAGKLAETNPVHKHLEKINVGDPVHFKISGEKLEICNSAGYPIGILSKSARDKWAAANEQIESVKVIAMIERRPDDSKDLDFKKLLKVDSWEVPVLEVVWTDSRGRNRGHLKTTVPLIMKWPRNLILCFCPN